ncbi:MAG TPA: hypothetical protein VGM79_08355 [Streptosporangiaceae bacterium]|jgi:hypothetical protein
MTKFDDQLFDDLMREHGPALDRTGPPAPGRRITPSRALLTAGGIGVAAAAAVTGVLVTGGHPAYAVTKNPGGTITLAVYQKSGVAGANDRLRQLGDQQVVVVPAGPGCPALGSLPPPATPATGHLSVQDTSSRDGSITVHAQGIPAGDILVVASQATAQGRVTGGRLTAAPAPSCVSLPAPPPPGSSGSGSGS